MSWLSTAVGLSGRKQKSILFAHDSVGQRFGSAQCGDSFAGHPWGHFMRWQSSGGLAGAGGMPQDSGPVGTGHQLGWALRVASCPPRGPLAVQGSRRGVVEAASLGGPGLRTPTESRFPSSVGHSTSQGQSRFGGVEKQIPPLDGRCSIVTVQREARAERGGTCGHFILQSATLCQLGQLGEELAACLAD